MQEKKINHLVELTRMQCINNEKVDLVLFREALCKIIPDNQTKVDSIINDFKLLKVSMYEKYNYY